LNFVLFNHEFREGHTASDDVGGRSQLCRTKSEALVKEESVEFRSKALTDEGKSEAQGKLLDFMLLIFLFTSH